MLDVIHINQKRPSVIQIEYFSVWNTQSPSWTRESCLKRDRHRCVISKTFNINKAEFCEKGIGAMALWWWQPRTTIVVQYSISTINHPISLSTSTNICCGTSTKQRRLCVLSSFNVIPILLTVHIVWYFYGLFQIHLYTKRPTPIHKVHCFPNDQREILAPYDEWLVPQILELFAEELITTQKEIPISDEWCHKLTNFNSNWERETSLTLLEHRKNILHCHAPIYP